LISFAIPRSRPLRTKKTFRFYAKFGIKTAPIASFVLEQATALCAWLSSFTALPVSRPLGPYVPALGESTAPSC
jgi:hypothetical protein